MYDLIKFFLTNYPVPSFFVYSLVVISLILALWHFARHTKIAQDIFNLYSFVQNREIKQFDIKINSGKFSNYELKVFEYKRKILEYQKDLKTTESHLPTLIFLNGYENSRIAVSMYDNASKFLIFNDVKNRIELKKPISEEHAKRKEHFGGWVFFINGIAAYVIMMIPITLFDKEITKNNAIPIAFFLFALMLLQVYLWAKFLRYTSKRSNALSLLEMKRVNVKYEEHIEK